MMANLACNRHYSLERAERYLNFAIQFTPQYGDSFLELLKLLKTQNKIQKINEVR